MGRFRAPALLQLAELPLFLGLLWLFCGRWGLVGATVAWLVRMSLDAMCLFLLCRLERGRWPSLVWMGAGLLGLAPFLLSGWDAVGARLLAWSLVLLAVLGVAWWRRATLLGQFGSRLQAEAA
jgi:O-antigen/teichoic acid export membrane protein